MGLMLAFVLGVGALTLAPDVPDSRGLAGVCLLVGLITLRIRNNTRGRVVTQLALAFGLGLTHAAWQAERVLEERLSRDLEGIDLDVVGVIASLPEHRPGGRLRFLFVVEQGTQAGQAVALPGSIRLSWYRSTQPIHAGERWQLRVRLRRPHGFSNPGGFDYEGWLFRQGVGAVGYVRPKADNRCLGDADSLPFTIARWRQGLRDRLQELVADSTGGSLLIALALGDRSKIGPEAWDVLTRTGTNHLVAISGLHLGIASGLAFGLGRRVWGAVPVFPLLVPARVAGAWAGLIVALAYAALAGFSLPTQRALVMVSVVLGALILRRSSGLARSLLLALSIILLLDPMAFGAVGLWLSFLAVGAIFYLFAARGMSPEGWLVRGVRLQWGISLALAPALLGFMGQVSLVAPLVNLVAVPLFSLLMVPLSLLATLAVAVPTAGDWLANLAADLLNLAYQGLAWAARTPYAVFGGGERPGWVWVVAVPGVLVTMAPSGVPGRWLGGVLLLPLVLNRPMPPPPGEARFTLLDVGQGLAAVIQTHRHAMVYDVGPAWSASFDAGDAVVVPFLRHSGIDRLDRVMLSHDDNDHAGGFESLQSAVPFEELLRPAGSKIEGLPCRAGQEWEWDGVWFRVLHPTDDLQGNDHSCVLMVENQAGRLLLPGDIETKAEAQLVARYGSGLAADVVVAPHHGSETSSTEAFVTATSPGLVLYSVGYRNRFGFPRDSVSRRWRAAGAEELDTVAAGAISVILGADGVLRGPSGHRFEQRRGWSDSGPAE